MEFAVLEIKGQSFMLHQIRKMVTVAIGISRKILTNDILKEAFSVEKICIPVAPGLGLSLHFVRYFNFKLLLNVIQKFKVNVLFCFYLGTL